MDKKSFFCRLMFVVALTVFLIPSMAFKQQSGKSTLDALVIVSPELRTVETNQDFREIQEPFFSQGELSKFLADNGDNWKIFIDVRRGVPSLIDGGAIPFIPGSMNSLSYADFGANCYSLNCISKEQVERVAREFLTKYPNLFPVKQEELFVDEKGTLSIGNSIYLLRFQWVVKGIPVENGSIFFRINNGNLIQIASSNIAPFNIDTTPSFSDSFAFDILNGYLGKDKIGEKDQIIKPATLVIVNTTPKGLDANIFNGEVGNMYSYRLTYEIVFRKAGVPGTYEALIDAKTGEILRFVDANKYGKIQGGVYKTDKNPTQTEVKMPFPYADYGSGVYSDIGGNFTGTSGTSTMTGRTGSSGNVGGVEISDNCGSISLSSDSNGLIDFGISSGTDCTTPGVGGAGNTHASRTQYYNISWIKIKAYTYLSGNSWLEEVVTDNVNIDDTCNAYWDGSSVNFFKSGGGCGNTGELPGVSLHEWGHGMDDNDGSGGDSPPVETRADWTAILQTHQSCAGGGFLMSYDDGCGNPPSQGSEYHNCWGYGDCCLDCSGVREADWDKHNSHTPWTIANYGSVWSGCDSGWYYGPCGKEDHCESGISTQALWDLAVRDLPNYCSMDTTSAWQLIDRLFYSSMPQLGDMYTCTPPTSNGCGGTSLFNLFRAIDDDGDGTANGTPHAQAIFQAFNRHLIACGAAGDPSNQNQTTCPALTTPSLTGTVGSNSATLNWGVVANATRYFIYRNDTSCDSGFTKIATVNAPTTTYIDNTATNGITSYYRVQAATDSDSCVSSMSNCVSITPQPCAGTIYFDNTIYNCASTVTVTVVDSTLTLPASVEVWSDTDSTHKTITLTDEGNSTYIGSFATVSGGAGATEVQVSDGDSLYGNYLDTDYCGTPNQLISTNSLIDCSPPVITNVQVTEITGSSAKITFSTDESTTSFVKYDTAIPPSAFTSTDSTFSTSHSIVLTNLTECTRFYFLVGATDSAGNISEEDNGGAYYNFKTTINVNPTYTKVETPPLAIPDNDLSGVTSLISISENKPIVDVNVKINITHAWDADLDIYLVHPDGTQVELSTDNGSSGDNYIDTVFDDQATTPITSGTPPFTGSFIPETPLSVLNGKSSQGNWYLKAVDDEGGITGQVENWSLILTYPPETCAESAGTVVFEDDVYGCLADELMIKVQDADLLGSGTVNVAVWSDNEVTPESLTLTENPSSSGTFKGSILTTNSAPVNGDGKVSTTGGKVYVEYIDADDGSGGTNISRTDDADIDCSGPVISNVTAINVTGSTATITFNTDAISDTTVYYGTTAPPSLSASDLTLVTSHSLTITGLSSCSTYYFYVQSRDEFLNPSIDDNGGSYYTFETMGGGVGVYTYSGSSIAIPDNNPVGISVPISVTDSGVITDVNVTININHTWDSDLDIYLIHPDGTQVELSIDNGGSGDNYTNTVFDDQATTPITSGTAPFTGSFIPEQPLSVLNGKNCNGIWYLKVADDSSSDTGSLVNYSIQITRVVPCNPVLEYSSNSFVDICSGTGSGNDGVIDPGEQVEIKVNLTNTGSGTATNVSATISSSSPDVTILNNSSMFPDITQGATEESLSSYIVKISSSATCRETIPIHISASCSESVSPFEGDFELTVGSLFAIPNTMWSESFDDTTFPPTGWAQTNVSGTAGNWARSTGTVHPTGGGTHSGAGLAYFNSWTASSGNSTRLYRSVSDLIPSTAADAEIKFFMYHDTGYPSQDRIQIQVSTDGTNWTNVGTAINRYIGTVGWAEHSIDISSFIGQSIYIGFLGISAYGNDCHIDDVQLIYGENGCSMTPCVLACVPPSKPVVTVRDGNGCLQNGVYIDYIAGTPSTRHDLYVDSALVASNISPNYFYNPSDSNQHTYIVRAINGDDTCFTDSDPVSFSDVNNGPTVAPVITSIVDITPLRYGLKITYTSGSPADRHDLYKDGVLVKTNFTSGSTYSSNDNLYHNFQVAAVKGICTFLSQPVSARDQGFNIHIHPGPKLPFPDNPIPPPLP